MDVQVAQIPIPHSKLELVDINDTTVDSDIICSKNSYTSKALTKDHNDDGCMLYFEFVKGCNGEFVLLSLTQAKYLPL